MVYQYITVLVVSQHGHVRLHKIREFHACIANLALQDLESRGTFQLAIERWICH